MLLFMSLGTLLYFVPLPFMFVFFGRFIDMSYIYNILNIRWYIGYSCFGPSL